MKKVLLKVIYKIEDSILPNDFEIEVTFNGEDYFGRANYGVWGPKQATPYWSIYPKDSIEEALKDATEGALSFSRGYPSDIVFWAKEDKYFDREGNEVSEDDIRKKRHEYNTKNN